MWQTFPSISYIASQEVDSINLQNDRNYKSGFGIRKAIQGPHHQNNYSASEKK
jgi:hypothetical protein